MSDTVINKSLMKKFGAEENVQQLTLIFKNDLKFGYILCIRMMSYICEYL